MKESEAIEWIKKLRDSEEIRESCYVENFIKACDMAIQALEKQIPKRPWAILETYENDIADVECPICRGKTDYDIDVIKKGHCWMCGQLLDWSDEDAIN